MAIRVPGPGLLLALFLGLSAAAFLGYRWYSTPAPPHVPLEGVQEEIAQAVESALQDVRENPRSGEAWGILAMVLHANGFDEHVQECYRQAERFDPANPRWPYLLGLHLLEGNRPQSIHLFQTALSRANLPEDRAAILFRLAQLSLEDQQLDEADGYLRELAKIEPNGPRLQFGLGSLAVARGDRAAARMHLRTLTDSPYARRQAYALLAPSIEDKQAARESLDLSIRLPRDESWPDSIEREAMAHRVDRLVRIAPFWKLKREGRDAEAMQFLRTFVAQRPDAEVCFIFGGQLYSRGELEEAERAFRESLRLNSVNARAHLFLGEVLFHRAEKFYPEAGTREQALGMFRETVVQESQALAREPTLGLAHLLRGHALTRLGRADEALRDFRTALLYLPQNSEAHRALGECLAEAGQIAEALEHLQHAVPLAPPGDTRPHDSLEKWRAKPSSKK